MPPAQLPFEQLDFLYMPSRDVAADLGFCVHVLGGEALFAIEAFGARVAEVRLSGGGPRLLLADHLEGEAVLPVHRVADLTAALDRLRAAGAQVGEPFGIPHGPCAELRMPGGQRLAIYELTRRGADARFAGRFDFEVPAG